jgi:hypothetical protein
MDTMTEAKLWYLSDSLSSSSGDSKTIELLFVFINFLLVVTWISVYVCRCRLD